MTIKHRASAWRSAACLSLLALSGLSCASDGPTTVPAQGAAALLPEIKALIGDAACDAPEQCRTIAIGSKSCGGPAAYWAWSTKRTEEARLRALAERQALLQRGEESRAGLASNCMMVLDPGASCVPTSQGAGQCRLNIGVTGGGTTAR